MAIGGAWGQTTVSINSFTSTSGSIDSNISYAAAKGTGTTDPALSSSTLRIYKPSAGNSLGGYVSITAASGYQITSVTLINSDDKAGKIVYRVDDGDNSTPQSLAKSASIAISDITASSVTFYNSGSDRLSISGFTVTYKSVFSSGTYTITYHANGATSGSVPIDENEYSDDNNQVAVLSNINLSKECHTFTGWDTVADGNGNSYTAGSTFTIENNTTLYAQWTQNTHAITMPDSNQYGTYTSSESDLSSVGCGENVTLIYTPAAMYEQYAATWRVNGTPITGDSFTMPDEDVAVTVSVEERNDVTFDFTNISGFSNWETSYSEHTVDYPEATVKFASANRQSSTITNQPVTKGQPVEIILKNNATMSSAKFVCTQWVAKEQTITMHYSTDGGDNYTTMQVTSTNFQISNNSLPEGTNAVKITFSSSSNQVGIASATIGLKASSTPIVATPTFTPAAGSYTEAQNVTISCETQGATIYYTTDGSTPDSTSLEYDGAISVSATTTVKAIAYLGSEYSSVTSATYTIITPSSIADARTSSDTNVTVKGVVTFKDGTTSYIEDATGAIAVYSSSLSSVALGDELLVSGKKKDFNGLLEIQNLTYSEILSQNNPLPLTTKTLAEINADFLNQNALQGMRVKIENAEIGAIQTNSNTTLSQDGTTTNIYKIPELSGISEGNIVNVNAIVSCYNGWQLRVAQASDVVLVSEGATYTVSVAQGQDTIVSVDPTEASSGTSIEVMVETPNGYYLSGISVIKETGDPVTSVSGGEGFYSFVMPAANVTVSANLLLYYDVNIAADQTDYIIVDPGRAYEGQEVAVMVEAPNGQQVSSVTVSKADLTEVETSFEDDLYYFIMPSEAVTVSATFEDIPTYVVTFNAGNGTCTTSTAQYQVGSDALILPTAEPSTECSAQGWNFMGWTTEQISGTTETAPVTLLTGEYAPTSDVTLYAVFTYASGASSESIWEKATSISVGDQVCLVCEGVSMELDSISTTSTKYGVGIAYTGSIAGLYPMTVEAGSAEGTYAFKNEVGKYLYWKSGNSLTVDTLDNKASWKVLFEEVSGVASNATIKNAADPARQIMWNYSSPRFACYAGQTPNYNSGTGYSAVQLYKLTGGATTIYATSMNCNSCVIEAEDLPYTEDFEGYTTSTNPVTFVEPDCWTLAHEYVVKDPDTVPNLYYSNSTTFIHSGNYSLRMWLRDIYAMPKISEDIDIRTLKMTLWVRQSYSFYMLQVGVMSDLNDESTFVPVAVINNGTTQMEMSEVDFSQYVGDGRYIAFKNIGTSSSDSHSVNYIDDITLSVSDVACGISSLPYSENFDSYTTAILAKTGVQPNCWTIAHKDVAMSGENEPQIYYNSNFAHESNYSLRMYGRCIYAMPKLDDNINVQDIRMSMYLRQPHSCYPLQVGVMSDLDDVNTYVPVTTIRNSSANIEHVTFDFSSYTGTGKYIVFRNVISGGSDPVSTNYIDDITLTQLDECGMITLPYQENFENMTTITTKATGIQPRCWAVAHEDVTLTNTNKPQLYYCSSFASSGNYTLRMYGRCIYAMPMLSDNVSVSDLTMGMYLRQPYACYPLQIGVMSDLDDASTFVPVTTIKIGGGNVQYVEVDFSSYTGEGKYIAFRNIISGGSDPVSTNYIDDININYTSEYTRALPFNMLVVNAPMDVEVEKFELSMELSQARAIENAMLENEVSIYPIPTTGEISIDASENVEKVEVYNNIGRLVATFNNQREINISDMPAGLYMLRVTLQGDAVVMKKVVKK